MKCPKCQTENPDAYKFCRECGAELAPVCPICGSKHGPTDKFCGACGHDLNRPKDSADTMAAYSGERRNVTVLFSDMAGYTYMTERLDPEEVKDIMQWILGR